LRIAHITSPDFPLTRELGGTESLVYNLVEKQLSEGHEVTVIGSRLTNDPYIKPVSLVNPAPSYSHWLLTWLSQRYAGAIHVCKSFTYLNSKFDVIHNHLSEEGIALSFLREGACLNTLHGAAHERVPQYCVSRLCSITCKTKLVAVSKFAYQQHKKFYGDNLIGYVHSGVNTKLLEYVPRINKECDLELCFSGRISPDKSVKEVIAIADNLRVRGVNVHLKIAGKIESRDLSYFNEVVSLIKKRPYINAFFNLKREYLRSLIGHSDAFIFPISKTEPLALAPLEAMACGTPVITLNRAAAPEYIIDGVNGFLCASTSEMADAALKYSTISRKNCRELVEKNFSVDSMCTGYMGMYKKVIEAS
jgi:glycosyltransferase involved in cell wall biosynthesis